MKLKYIKQIGKGLVATGFLAGLAMTAHAAIYEDFSGPISLDKFWGMEKSIQLDTTNQVAVISAKGRAFTGTGRSNNLSLVDSSTTLLQADVNLTELSLGNSASQNAMLGIAGTFYNAQSASPTDQVGDVFIRVTLGDRGNGPEAWYELQESIDPAFNDSTLVTGSLGTISLNTSYTISIAYDGDNSFTIIFNNGTAVNVDGPVRMGEANSPFRSINQRLRFGRDNSSPDDWVEIADNGTPAAIAGRVDNVTTDTGLLDDFSSTNLNQAIWNQDQTSIAVLNNKLEMQVTGQGPERSRDRIFIKEKGSSKFGAKVALLSSSTINDTTRVRGRLSHYLSNDTYDVGNGATPNGWEGIIWTQFAVERSGGNNRVFAYAERASNADWSAWEELFFKNLGPINLDQEYELLIEKKGTLVEYKLDGAVVHSFDLATDHSTILSGDDFSPVGDVESSLDTRVQNDSGRAHVTFDDVVTDEVPSTGVGPTDPGSSGGGAMNPLTLLFAFGLLASLARRRQQ